MNIEYMACDGHKKYSVFVGMDGRGRFGPDVRIEHTRESFRDFLDSLPPHLPVALETTGFYYWMVEEIESAGHQPLLVNANRAKLMMGQINKTDRLDARGLVTLLRNGTLPTVWIPPAELRDQRELHRTRMVFAAQRTRLKNRIHATLAKHLVAIDEVTDIFGEKGRHLLHDRIGVLPDETCRCLKQTLDLLDLIEEQIRTCEDRIRIVIREDAQVRRIMSLPGVGKILGVVIAREIGDIARFRTAEQLAAYSGTTPRIKASGGKIRMGRVRPDVNRYLKWAFIEAAHCLVKATKQNQGTFALELYERVKSRKGYRVALMAVARHLAESAFWVLKKGEDYHRPHRPIVSSRLG